MQALMFPLLSLFFLSLLSFLFSFFLSLSLLFSFFFLWFSYTLNSTVAGRNRRRQLHSSCRLDSQCSGDRAEEKKKKKCNDVLLGLHMRGWRQPTARLRDNACSTIDLKVHANFRSVRGVVHVPNAADAQQCSSYSTTTTLPPSQWKRSVQTAVALCVLLLLLLLLLCVFFCVFFFAFFFVVVVIYPLFLLHPSFRWRNWSYLKHKRESLRGTLWEPVWPCGKASGR